MHFLFSFGSNLDTSQMLRRCPDADILGTAVVPGWRLAFGGYSASRDGAVATMERGGDKSRCYGVVAALHDADLIRMDACEGAGYERVLVDVRPRSGALADGGSIVTVQTYLLRDARPWLPAPAYVGQIATAYTAWGFDAAYLSAAVTRAVRGVQADRTAAQRIEARREAARVAKVRAHLKVQPMLPALVAHEEAVIDADDSAAAEARRRMERLAVIGVVRRRNGSGPVT